MKSLILLGHDQWSEVFTVCVEFCFNKEKPDWTIKRAVTASDFLEKVQTRKYDGICLVFNPFIKNIEMIWPEFQKLTIYEKLPVLFFANFCGVDYAEQYVRSGHDSIIDFCQREKLNLKLYDYLNRAEQAMNI